MSGRYPNGGYRTKGARELSMPERLPTPSVTANTAPRPGNTMEIIPPPRSGDLRGKMTPGLQPSTLQTHEGRVHLDLGRMSNWHGYDQLDWRTREKFRLRQTIDLDPRRYKVDGRGYIAREAYRLARNLIKGGRALPRNLYKELALQIAEMILEEIARTTNLLQAGPMFVPEGWRQLTYGRPEYNGGIPADAMGSVMMQGPVPNVAGTRFMAQSIYNPQPNNPNKPYSAPISGQYITPDNDGQFSVRMGLFIKHGDIGNRSYHGASWDRPAGSPDQVVRWTRPNELLSSTAAPRPYASVRSSAGNQPPNEFKPAKLPFKQRDRKMYLPMLNGALKVAYTATEVGDTIDCIYKALPRHKQYGRSYIDKMSRIYEAFDGIDWEAAMGCIAMNHVTDPLWGRGFDWIDKRTRRMQVNGIGYSFKPTYEGWGGTVTLSS